MEAGGPPRDGANGLDERTLLQNVLDSLSAHLVIVDEAGTVVAVNEPWRRFAAANGGDPVKTGVGSNYLRVLEAAEAAGVPDAAEMRRGLLRVLRGEESLFYCEYACGPESGKRWFAMRVTRASVKGRSMAVIAHDDITRRRDIYDQLHHAAHHDELTGLPNRKMLLDQLQRCVTRASRRPETRFAILFLDVDRFKVINDSMGHGRGDELLVAMADRLRQAVRETDVVARCGTMIARLGGDEFTILLEDVEGPGDAERIATRIHSAMADPFIVGGQELFVTVSIGITLHQSEDSRDGPEDYLRDADIAMYRAKAVGAGRHQVFESPMRDGALTRMTLERDLRRALQAGQMLLHFQPIVSLQHRRITGFEALIRWRHPERGMVPPDQFIRVAEEVGMIVPIGRWVLATACRQLAIWQRQFGPDLTMAVNVSSTQLSQGGLVEAVDRVLQAGQLDPRSLKLEITESALLEPSQGTTEDLVKLNARRVQLCLDDFGTGCSSLTHLHRLPIDVLKIDRSFVSRIHENERDEQLVSGIATLALRLGLDVVAEGVETSRQAQMLRRMGCKFAQGYFFAKPMPAEDATHLLVRQAAGDRLCQQSMNGHAALTVASAHPSAG